MRSIIVILLLCLAAPANAVMFIRGSGDSGGVTQIVRYVNTASAGGDGTTNNESGATAAYASLSAWESAEQTDLVAANESMLVYVSTGSGTAADTTAVTISGWTMDATHNITIEQASTDRHGGKWNTNVYRLERAGDIIGINDADSYVTLDGLQVHITGDPDYAQGIYLGGSATGEINARNLIVFADSLTSATTTYGIEAAYSASKRALTLNIRNSLIYGFGSSAGNCDGIRIGYNSIDAASIDNVTVISCDVGLASGGVASATNAVTRSCTDGFYGTFATASDYNSSDISGDAPNTGGSGNDNTASPWYSGATADSAIFVDAANDDYHLTSGSTIFDSVGANLYSDFTDDIDDETRPNAAFDLGADEFH